MTSNAQLTAHIPRFQVSVFQRFSFFEWRQPIAITPDQRWELARAPEARAIQLRIPQDAQQPPQVETVRPNGNRSLIPGDKTKGSADAVNCGAIGKFTAKVESQLLLSTATDRDDDVTRLKAIKYIDQRRVFDPLPVNGRDIGFGFVQFNLLLSQPVA